MMKRLIAVLLYFFLCGQAATAGDVNPDKAGDIRRLIEVTGSANMARQMAAASSRQMFSTLKAARPEIPDRALAVMNVEFMAVFSENIAAPGGLLDRMVPIFDKHYTHEEIKELIAFYQTPLGKKVLAVTPLAAQESMTAGQEWGKSLAPEISRRIRGALIREGWLPDRNKAVS